MQMARFFLAKKKTQINYFKFSKFVLHLHTHTVSYRVFASPPISLPLTQFSIKSRSVYAHTPAEHDSYRTPE